VAGRGGMVQSLEVEEELYYRMRSRRGGGPLTQPPEGPGTRKLTDHLDMQ